MTSVDITPTQIIQIPVPVPQIVPPIMSRRDFFAAMAMKKLVSLEYEKNKEGVMEMVPADKTNIASVAVQYADALILALDKKTI